MGEAILRGAGVLAKGLLICGIPTLPASKLRFFVCHENG
jgi:hypothetical protein